MLGAPISDSIFKQPRRFRCKTVIASEAKQSILPLRGKMDCFAALALTSKATSIRKTTRHPCQQTARRANHNTAVARMERSAIRGLLQIRSPDLAEPVIGRRFAPTRWLYPGYDVRDSRETKP